MASGALGRATRGVRRPQSTQKGGTVGGALAAGLKSITSQGGYKAPSTVKSPTIRSDMYGGGAGGSVGRGGITSAPAAYSAPSQGGGMPAMAAFTGPDPTIPVSAGGGMADADWLKSDGEYTAAEAAYRNVFNQLAATLDRENGNYERDYSDALKNLGWIDPDGADGPQSAAWAMNNIDTAAGRSYNSLFDDYAGRGMLQGTAFGNAENSLRTSLDKQRDMVDEQRNQFNTAQKERRTQGEQTRDNSIKMAAAQALARAAAGLGV